MLKRTLDIPTAEVFEPLLHPARYKGAHGGRGSAKSHFFAGLVVEDALRAPGEMGEGLRVACIREVQKDLKESAKKLIENKLISMGLGEQDGFKIWKREIETPKDGLIFFEGMKDHTADSVKSLENVHRAWVEEAHTLSETSLMLLRPTIRAPKSELLFSWNPRRKVDPVDAMFRSDQMPTGGVCVRSNWSDNPWFPDELEQERRDCLRDDPEIYDHVWEGDYATIHKGAYFAKSLAKADRDGRIANVGADPLMTTRAIWDIGGSGDKADGTAIWIAQYVGREIRVLDYYEAVGQPLSAHVSWLRKRGYEDALCILPHDGPTHDRVHKVSFESELKRAGFDVKVVPNQGAGAAMARVEIARRLFNLIWFNKDTTEAGRDALGWYHEKWDEKRSIGLGPEHDWSSHAADAFGLMCIDYKPPVKQGKPVRYRSKPRFMG